MKRVTLFTRASCHLCDDAYAALERVRRELPFELEIKDIDRDATAAELAAYTFEVPVIEVDGKKAMKFRVDEARLRRLLAQADRLHPPRPRQ